MVRTSLIAPVGRAPRGVRCGPADRSTARVRQPRPREERRCPGSITASRRGCATTTRWCRAACSPGAGVSETQRRRLVEHGVLERVVDGAYRFRGVPDDELSRCVALCSSRPRLVVAGPTAGRIWGIRRSPRDQLVHVLAPPASNPCREPWVRAYRTALIDPGDIVHCRDGLRLTSPPRHAGRPRPPPLLRGVDVGRRIRAARADVHAGDDAACRPPAGDAGAAVGAPISSPSSTAASTAPPANRAGSARWWTRCATAGCATWPRSTASRSGRARLRFDIALPAVRWALEIDVHPEHRTLEGQAQRRPARSGPTSTRLAHRACRRGRVAPRLRSGDR